MSEDPKKTGLDRKLIALNEPHEVRSWTVGAGRNLTHRGWFDALVPAAADQSCVCTPKPFGTLP